MRKEILFLLLFFFCVSTRMNATQKAVICDDKLSEQLYVLAGKNLNYSSSIAEAKVLELCQKIEASARSKKNYTELFLAQQIVVNSLCLKGDVGLAVDKSQQMYKEAKGVQCDVGIALSIQAIGDTYMYSSQYKKAIETFNEAKEMLSRSDDKFLLMRLLIQQMHAGMLLGNLELMQQNLIDVRKLLDRLDISNKSDYAFYIQCYQTFYDIRNSDKELAWLSLEKLRELYSSNQLFSRCYYSLVSTYHKQGDDYEKALLYCDSALNTVGESGDLIAYKKLMISKAALLVANKKKKEACGLYQQVRQLEDSLDIVRYSKQIDSLHVNYWVDQMEIQKATMHNHFLTWTIIYAAILLFVGCCFMYVARRRNRQLINSRLKLDAIRKETSESIQSKSLFLSNMSHELRTPLNAIVGFAELLSMEAVDDADTKMQFGDRIKHNADLLLRLFNDVADLSALKDNNIPFVFDTHEAVAICRNVVDTVENVKQTSAAILFRTSVDSLPIYTDAGRLQQVLINLLINATKFTSEGTITLILELNEAKEEATFIVEDTGCGIPLAKQAYIFDRFEKLHEGIQGAGLGLSICQLIVEHIGGKIWVDSQYGGGARFVFTHPLKNK